MGNRRRRNTGNARLRAELNMKTVQKAGVSMATTTTGNCYVCGAELGKTAMKNHLVKEHGKEGTQECCLLKVEGAHDKDYWLFIDVPINKTLSDIDDFLRKIWLECCGHLSEFCTPERRGSIEIEMDRKLKTFAVGDKIIHEYDFGTTTTSLITFMGVIMRSTQKRTVRLLARNIPPIFQCRECNATASFICMECIYDSYNPFICAMCSENHDHDDMLLPVTNSPRMGACGYEGELDVYAYNPIENAKTQNEDMVKPVVANAPKIKSKRTTLDGQISFDEFDVPDTDFDEPKVKPRRQPKQNGDSGGIVSPFSIKDYCESNQDFKSILNLFNNGYIPAYNKRKISLRNEVSIYMRRNFSTWYYSVINDYFPISPARFINSDINHKFGSSAVVFPFSRPVFSKSKISEIEYTFRVFTLDNHPFISDMQLLLESIKSIHHDEKHEAMHDSIFSYVISHFSDIIERAEFTFAERPYIIVLGDVCERLSFISMTDAHKGGVLISEEPIEAFFSLPGRKKLGRVIDVLIERFVECIDSLELSGKRPDAEDVLKTLREEHDIESFLNSLFGDMLTDLSDELQTLADEDFDPNEFLGSLEGEKAKAIKDAQAVISICCSHFFSVFGQYLQMIQPENDAPFAFSKADDEYLVALGHEMVNADDLYFKIRTGAMVYYIPPGGYGLTPVGADWFGIDLSGQDDRLYSPVSPEYYQEIFNGMVNDDSNEAIDELMRKVLSDPEQADEVTAMLESFFDFDLT